MFGLLRVCSCFRAPLIPYSDSGYWQGWQEEQVRIVTPGDFVIPDNSKPQKQSNVLHAANPKDPQFSTPNDWLTTGVRIVMFSKSASIGVNGLQFIENLVLWSPPSGSLEQLYGRFKRPAARYNQSQTTLGAQNVTLATSMSCPLLYASCIPPMPCFISE